MTTQPPPPTIIDLKTNFLRTQIITLSTPLRPSSGFTTTNADADHALREKSIDDALHKLNARLRKHVKLAYGPQSTRHVAEQVDRLYWNAGERVVGVGGGSGEVWKERGVDLRNEDVIALIPEEWEGGQESELAARFAELQGRLKELDGRRKAAREKVEGYRRMRDLLGPFGEEGGGGVQENLVTRNGEVEKELERMRMLMLRVERGVGGLAEREGEGEVEGDKMEVDWEGEGARKVDALLMMG